MSRSPLERFLSAVDGLDVDRAMSLFAPECRLLTVEGRRVEGPDAVRAMMLDFVSAVRSTHHRITAQWHEESVWIAEVDATYELKDLMVTGVLPRAFVLRDGPDGIVDLRVYGAHERPLTEHRTGGEGMRIGGRWLPPL
jgi:hypothetical protein